MGLIVLVLLCYCCIKGCEGFFNCCERCIVCVMNIHTERKKAKNNNLSKYFHNI